MGKFALTLISIFFISIFQAQLIDNANCQAFSDEPFFDAQFIKKNKIKTIHGEIKTKGNLEVIKDAKLVSKYEFDRDGKLILQLGSFNIMGSKDTTFINYNYDEYNNLITKRTNDAYGFFSYNFEFDTNQRVISKVYCREENIGKDRYHFELGKQYTIVKESYTYIDIDSVLIKSIYNNHDRIYQKTTFTYNEFDLLETIQDQYVINKKIARTSFTYTDEGFVESKTYMRDAQKPENFEKWEYKYDELGNLTYIDYYKGEVHTTHKEVLYNPSTFMLKALLVQDVPSNFITIIKFNTTYFED